MRELRHPDGGEPNVQERQIRSELIKLFWCDQHCALLNVFRD